ncbi:centromere protein V-like isoform X2 [Stegodyphus dumicola]|nr:centromere protein V-like isoform X2 [Stegodyphus dumicola]XP_035212099.1 centromere protein V-like isoform X2 [Stegodyphus dumicola]XP_035212100.1 centromere protein V-like isoform X2 [Stegodyphus dumicola]XP_035212101.1 centromere protein V-like isoform X2 [Stegodyphus dumicola]XP_035212102.1 centromere protein V-like isoform X2 [Stegodyphus dumicola]
MKMESKRSNVQHSGGCHCGAVRFVALGPPRVKVYKCNCSICSKKQIKGFFVPQENFSLLKGKDDLSEYTFNTGIAKHYFCKVCGVQSFYKPRSNPTGMSIMIYCLDSGTIEDVEEIEFDGQNWEASMKKNPPICSH